MACEAEHRPLGVFECQLCALAAPYSYVGQKPPDTQSVILLEESYVMKDPFTPDKDRFLILGSRCSVCGRLVCVGPVEQGTVLCRAFVCQALCLELPSPWGFLQSPPPKPSQAKQDCSHLTGMQSVLLQEVLPPLCPEEPPGLPPGDPAGPGEKERPREEAGGPAQLAGLSRRRRPRSGAELGATVWPCSGAAQRRHLGTPPRLQSSLSAEHGQEPRGAQALKGLGPHPLQVLPAGSCSTWLGWRALRPSHEGSDPGVVSTRLCWALNTAVRGKGRCRGSVPVCGPLAPAVGGGGGGGGERVLPLALVPAQAPAPSPHALASEPSVACLPLSPVNSASGLRRPTPQHQHCAWELTSCLPVPGGGRCPESSYSCCAATIPAPSEKCE